jgi:glycosyltransferase involved in cell wall biosynthesis
MYKITFVLPVYNAQVTIAKCLESLISQKYRAEIIVIDDCSTDNTLRIAENYIKDIILIRNPERMGAAWCRNYGNKRASEQIIAVCDADIYYPDRGKTIKEFFQKFKDMDVFYSALHLKESRNMYQPTLMDAYEWDFKSKSPISHPTVAYRKKVAMDCPYHEDSIDTDLYEFMLLDAHRKGYKFGWDQYPSMMKYEGNSIRDVSGAKKLKLEKYKEYGIEITS